MWFVERLYFNSWLLYLKILHKWFHEKHMVLNPGKCHYIVIWDDGTTLKIILNNNEIASSNANEEKFLGILLDWELWFWYYISL